MKPTNGKNQIPFFQALHYRLNLQHHLSQEEGE